MTVSSGYRILATVLLVAVLSGVFLGVGSVGASDPDIANKPDDLESVHDGMDGTGTVSDPYEVSNILELQSVTTDLESHYLLVDDIDARPTAIWDSGEGFEPIGRGNFGSFPMDSSKQESIGFRGSFDGNGNEIYGLKIDRAEGDVGLFAGIGKGGDVRNLTIREADINASARVGTVAGLVIQGEIQDVDVVDSQTNAHDLQGGLVGLAYNNTHLERVTFEGETSPDGVGMGGIVGWMSNESHVRQCRSNVEMSGEDGLVVSQVSSGTGGVVGAISNSTISQCGAVVDIDAPSQERVGGLVGFVMGDDDVSGYFDVDAPETYSGINIEDSYVEGQIAARYSAGGLAGAIVHNVFLDNAYILDTAYIAANVTSEDVGEDRDGIICGVHDVNNGCSQEEYNLYYDYDYEGTQPINNGSDVTPLYGYEIRGDPAEDHLDGFDFETVWSPTNSPWLDYPHLQWEDRPEDSDSPLDLSWRFFEIAKVMGEYLVLLGGVSGLLGLLLSHGRQTIKRRSVGLIIGSVVGLLTITIVGSVFEGVAWVMTGETTVQAGAAMLPPLLEDRDIFYQVMPIMSALSQISVTIGAAAVSVGSGVWAISSKGSSSWTTSRRSISVGIALMVLSVGGHLFTVAGVVVFGSVG